MQTSNEDLDKRVADGRVVVRRIAKRMCRRLGQLIAFEELEALGLAAFAEVLTRYDPSRGAFDDFIAFHAHKAMLTGLRKDAHVRAGAARARLLAASDRACREHQEAAAGKDLLTEEEQKASLASLLEQQAAVLVAGVVALDEELGLSSPVATPEEAAMRAESGALLAAAVEQLPERERALVQRHYFRDEKFDEIAGDLGISAGYASKLHDRALMSLGRALKRVSI